MAETAGDDRIGKVPFLKFSRRFAATPHFPGYLSPSLPSRNSKRRIAMKIEVSNNERTDTCGGVAIAAPA